MIQVDALDQMVADEKLFSRNDYFGDRDGNSEIIVFERPSPIILTAPHAVKHSRYGDIKEEDKYTGSLTIWLAKQLNASAIVPHYFNPDLSHITQLSPGFISSLDELSLKSAILIDIHGMKDTHSSGLCIGTGNQDIEQAPISKFVNNLFLSMSEWDPSHNFPFSAQSSHTLVNYTEENVGIPALQLEIPKRFRVPGAIQIEEQLEYLTALVESISQASYGLE